MTTRSGWLVPLLVLIVGMFMSVLDISIVNVAIPTMQRDFGTTVDDIQWISTAYTLALGVVVPMSGWLGDRIGLSRIYLYALIGFAACSALCGLAWDLPSMVAFRILQAVPGGVLPVVTVSLLMAIVPRERIGGAMGIYGLGVVVAPAIGPTLGGYLVEYVDWRLIFLINVPAGVLGVVGALLALPRTSATSLRRFDWFGFLSSASGLFALLLAVSEGEKWGWDSYRVRMLLVFAVLALALFVVIEMAVAEPLIDLRVFGNWMFVNSLLLIMVLSVGLYAVLSYLPLFVQQGQGLQPLRVGLVLLPEALVMGVLMPIAGRLYDLFGPRWPGIIGLSVAAFGGFLLCGIGPSMSQQDVILWTCVRAFGNGLAMMPIMTAGLAAIPPALVGSASLVNNVVQRASSALGLALMTVLATSQQAHLMLARSALVPAASAQVAAAGIVPNDRVALYGYYRALRVNVMGQAYSNVFLVAAILTCVAIGLAALMRKPPVEGLAPAADRAEDDRTEPAQPALAAVH